MVYIGFFVISFNRIIDGLSRYFTSEYLAKGFFFVPFRAVVHSYAPRKGVYLRVIDN